MYIYAYFIDENGAEKLGLPGLYNNSTVDRFEKHPVFENMHVPAIRLNESWKGLLSEFDVSDKAVVYSLLLDPSKVFETLAADEAISFLNFIQTSSKHYEMKVAERFPF